jgi:hypothetical protein
VGVAEAAECGLVLEPIIGGASAVSDVFEVEVVVPWGEEGVVVPRGDHAPVVHAYGESLPMLRG